MSSAPGDSRGRVAGSTAEREPLQSGETNGSFTAGSSRSSGCRRCGSATVRNALQPRAGAGTRVTRTTEVEFGQLMEHPLLGRLAGLDLSDRLLGDRRPECCRGAHLQASYTYYGWRVWDHRRRGVRTGGSGFNRPCCENWTCRTTRSARAAWRTPRAVRRRGPRDGWSGPGNDGSLEQRSGSRNRRSRLWQCEGSVGWCWVPGRSNRTEDAKQVGFPFRCRGKHASESQEKREVKEPRSQGQGSRSGQEGQGVAC